MNAPLVISASRRTDIPAFYADWFMARMEAGFCEYPNPYTQKPVRVDLTQVKFVVFWTKNARPMLKHLKRLDEMGVKYYFQYTLNNYDGLGVEQGVSGIDGRIETFCDLSRMIGKEKVILRCDPLLLPGDMTIWNLQQRVLGVVQNVCDFTEKMVFSFAGLDYRKVKCNIAKSGLQVRSLAQQEMEQIAGIFANYAIAHGLKLATCSEAIDLSKYGIEHNRCIDPELILRITDNDPDIADYLVGNSGQRSLCGCAKSVDIGMYDTCVHDCVYCYATRDKELAFQNYQKHNQNNISII